MTNLEKIRESYFQYVRLSNYLFGHGENGIYDINEIPKDNEFFKPAQKIAKQLKISWKAMTHEESNRIMLALLEDSFCQMKEDLDEQDRGKLIIEVKFKLNKE